MVAQHETFPRLTVEDLTNHPQRLNIYENGECEIEIRTVADRNRILDLLTTSFDDSYPSQMNPASHVVVTQHSSPEDPGHVPFVDLNDNEGSLPEGTVLRLQYSRTPFRPLEPGQRLKAVYEQGDPARITPDSINTGKLLFEPYTVDRRVMLMNDPNNGSEWHTEVFPEGDFIGSPWNTALHYAGGMITGIRAYSFDDGIYVFRLDEHIKRMVRDAEKMRFQGVTFEMLYEAFKTMLKVNARWVPRFDNPHGNFFYVRGIGSPNNIDIRITGPNRMMNILGTPVGNYMPDRVNAVFAEQARPVPAGMGAHKTTLGYEGAAQVLLAHNQAGSPGYRETLFADGHQVQEGLSANVALVQYGKGAQGRDLIHFPEHPEILPSIVSRSVEEILRRDERFETRRGLTDTSLLEECEELVYLGTAAAAMEAMRLDRRGHFDEEGHLLSTGDPIFKRERTKLGRATQAIRRHLTAISRREEGVHEDFRAWMQKVV